MFTCAKCKTHYVLASIGTLSVWMAVEPWSNKLCAGGCSEEAWTRR